MEYQNNEMLASLEHSEHQSTPIVAAQRKNQDIFKQNSEMLESPQHYDQNTEHRMVINSAEVRDMLY